jgi:hypothetical protein
MAMPTFPRALAFASILLTHASITACAQADEQNPDYVPPRTQHGDPDLQGIWSNATITPLERPSDLGDREFLSREEAEQYEAQRLASTNRDQRTEDKDTDVRNAYNDFWWDSGNNIVTTRRTSLIVDPADGRIPPYTSAAQARIAAQPDFNGRRSLATFANFTDGPEDQDLMTRCILFNSAGPPMLPSAYNNNYHLVQTADHVLIVNEMVHETRSIPLDRNATVPAGLQQWHGSSRGYWDGDTLVVETTNFREETAFSGSTANLHLTERFTRIDNDVLIYEFTVDDPETFEQPWTVQIPSVRVDGLMYEYACHEGNRGLYGILAGAREAEKAADGASD